MTIAACPSCHENVTLPADAQPDSIVRCPLCQDECKLDEFLAQLPPELIVVNDARSPSEDIAAWSFPDESQAQTDELSSDSEMPDQVQLDSASDSAADDSDVPAFDFASGSAPEVAVVVTSTARTPRAPKKPAVEIVKVVAGGLLAVPLALMILLWLPGKWQRDPLQVGLAIGRVLPWIVPANCRPPKQSSGPEFQRDISQRPQRRPEAAPRSPTLRSKPKSQADDMTNKNVLVVPPPADRGVANSKPDGKPASAATTEEPSELPSIVSPAAATQPAANRVIGVRNAVRRTGKQLHAALETAVQANAAWDARTSQTPASQTELIGQLYAAFARLGEVITYVDPHDDGVRETVGAVQSLLLSITMHPTKLAALGNGASQWLEKTDRDSDGILLFGTVKRVRLLGQLYDTELDLAARKQQTVSIISRMDPNGIYRPADRILVLGAIVDDPIANLAGYEGKQPRVIMAGFPVPIGR